MQLRHVPGPLFMAISYSLHQQKHFPDILKKSDYSAVSASVYQRDGMADNCDFKQAAGSQAFQRRSLGNMIQSILSFFHFFLSYLFIIKRQIFIYERKGQNLKLK